MSYGSEITKIAIDPQLIMKVACPASRLSVLCVMNTMEHLITIGF